MSSRIPSELQDQFDRQAKELCLAKLKLRGIEAISRSLVSECTVEEILEDVMTRTTELLGAERASLYLLDDSRDKMWSQITQGEGAKTINLEVGEGLAGWVVQHGRCLNVKDAYKDPRFNPEVDKLSNFQTRSVLCHPLLNSRQQVIGAIQVLNKKDGYFAPGDEDLLAAIASQAAIGIQNSRLYSDIVVKNIELMEAGFRLDERRAELELLFKIERAAATATSRDSALLSVLNAAMGEFPSEVIALILRDPNTGALRYAQSEGEEAHRILGHHIEGKDSLAHSVLASGESVSLRSVQSEVLGRDLHRAHPNWAIRTIACIPVFHRGDRLGSLQLINRLDDPRGYEESDIRILEVIASRMALTLALARVMAEEQKRDRLSAIGQMLSGIVHDLKTPLTIINGYAQLLAGERPPETRDKYKGHIQKQIGEIRGMTSELLAFARGESQILLRKVHMNTFLNDVRELLETDFKESGTALVIEDHYGGSLRVDQGKMWRVVANLARNALEALDGSGTFRVTVRGSAEVVRFEFSDDGPGIPEAMSGRLFESFATHGKTNGTGLGLAIVKKIIEEHGGSIAVESTPGVGTSFIVELPQG